MKTSKKNETTLATVFAENPNFKPETIKEQADRIIRECQEDGAMEGEGEEWDENAPCTPAGYPYYAQGNGFWGYVRVTMGDENGNPLYGAQAEEKLVIGFSENSWSIGFKPKPPLKKVTVMAEKNDAGILANQKMAEQMIPVFLEKYDLHQLSEGRPYSLAGESSGDSTFPRRTVRYVEL